MASIACLAKASGENKCYNWLPVLTSFISLVRQMKKL